LSLSFNIENQKKKRKQRFTMTYIDEGKACAMKTWKHEAVDASGNLEILMEMRYSDQNYSA
jgi:hypothetical protein